MNHISYRKLLFQCHLIDLITFYIVKNFIAHYKQIFFGNKLALIWHTKESM